MKQLSCYDSQVKWKVPIGIIRRALLISIPKGVEWATIGVAKLHQAMWASQSVAQSNRLYYAHRDAYPIRGQSLDATHVG